MRIEGKISIQRDREQVKKNNKVWQIHCLSGVFARPFSCRRFISSPVRLEHMGNFRNQRIIRVWISQKRTNTE